MERRLWEIPKKVSEVLFHSQWTPVILLLSVFSLLIILFRMKSIEQDYKFNELNHKIENEIFESKELKAKKAKLMSIKNLGVMAKKYSLEQPKEEQIIVIP